MSKYYVGIDIGSTASKTVVIDENQVVDAFTLPTGWSGQETAENIYEKLKNKGYADDMTCVATGYGRVCVHYANKVITEITCHGKGGWCIFKKDGIIVDVGGQDTKIIEIENGAVKDFLMNDKCAAGTGKFIEVMAARLGTGLNELYDMAAKGDAVSISSMCTVFAESEVIGHIATGRPKQDIAAGVIDSVAARVAALAIRYPAKEMVLTGGLCDSPYFIKILSQKSRREVMSHPFARYAGALGAALTAAKKSEVKVEWSK